MVGKASFKWASVVRRGKLESESMITDCPSKMPLRPRVLFLLNNAPDYREPFLRDLSTDVDLTVVARSCEGDALVPPEERVGYRYIELPVRRVLGTVRQPGLGRIVRKEPWDVVCSSINMRDTGRIGLFLRSPKLRAKWVWWGHIFGRSVSPILRLLRSYLLRNSAGALVFNEEIAGALRREFPILVASFNNTQVRECEFRAGVFRSDAVGPANETVSDSVVRLLFVGRNQPRKRLERLVGLAERRRDVAIRFVGPGMETISVPEELRRTERITIYGRTVGAAVAEHFDWADLVANPGHVGLLVLNTAQHGKGIVIDRTSDHAPEYLAAQEAGQPFIDFSDSTEIDAFFDALSPDKVQRWGEQLQGVARRRYTIEHMARVHRDLLFTIVERTRSAT